MPINASHAYGIGTMYTKGARSSFFRIFLRLQRWFEAQKAQMAWEAFEKSSVIGQECFFGPNSWCDNQGKREDIVLGDRVYCRGLIRRGPRGNGRIIIHDEVYIGDDCILSSENLIEIGSLTLLAHGVSIFDSTGHPTTPELRELDWRITMGQKEGERPTASSSPVRIGKRVWIGFNSTIMRGVTIGDNAVIASGSMVIDDVKPNTIVAGNPAKEIKDIG